MKAQNKSKGYCETPSRPRSGSDRKGETNSDPQDMEVVHILGLLFTAIAVRRNVCNALWDTGRGEDSVFRIAVTKETPGKPSTLTSLISVK